MSTAATKTCPTCGNPIPAETYICPNDGTPQYAATVPIPEVTPPEPAPTTTDASTAGAPPPGLPATETPWTCPVDGSVVVGPTCPADGTPRPASPAGSTAAGSTAGASCGPVLLTVVLPDGTSLDLHDGAVVDLGRHSPDPAVARALGSFEGVSRTHASLAVSGGRLAVVDHDSTNGTRLDGVPVQGRTDVPLDTVRTIQLGRYAVVHLRRNA